MHSTQTGVACWAHSTCATMGDRARDDAGSSDDETEQTCTLGLAGEMVQAWETPDHGWTKAGGIPHLPGAMLPHSPLLGLRCSVCGMDIPLVMQVRSVCLFDCSGMACNNMTATS